MDVTSMRKSVGEFLAVAEGGGFGPPPAGEWDAEHNLAHVASALASGAAAALAIAAGQRVVYDNRVSLDEWNLQRIVDGAGGLPGLIDLVRRYGELVCEVAAGLTERERDVSLNVLIVSKDQLIVDQPRPIGSLLTGLCETHLPPHADQLRGLRG
ncbi:MAG TPA: hypothetical protein VIX15_17960 [Streptosporangiaceae bacterium]